jgi:hypothetical protein
MTIQGAVLIVNYNCKEALHQCLRSLQRSDGSGLSVLVVDNASGDGSRELLADQHPRVEVLVSSSNLGFAGAVNLGLQRLLEQRQPRILLLNPDTVVKPDFLTPLEATVAQGADLAGPKLVLPGQPTRLWCAGGTVTFGLNLSRLHGHGELDRGQLDHSGDVTFLPGTAWWMPRSTVEQIGLLDETFFCYVEDVDYCLRMANQGLRIRYEPRSVVEHAGSHASGGGYTSLRKYLNALGSVHLLRKHGNLGRWLCFLGCDVLTTPLALGYGLLQRRPTAALWKVRGLWDGFLGRGFTDRRRQQLLPRGEQ